MAYSLDAENTSDLTVAFTANAASYSCAKNILSFMASVFFLRRMHELIYEVLFSEWNIERERSVLFQRFYSLHGPIQGLKNLNTF